MRERHTPAVNDFKDFGLRKLARYGVAILVTGFAAGAIGPFGTYETMYLGPRYAFWLSTIAIGWAEMLLISYAIRGFIGGGKLAGWPTLLVAAAIGTVPILFEVRWLNAYLAGENARLAPLWLAYVNVYLLTGLFSVVQWTLVEGWPLIPRADAVADSVPGSDGAQFLPTERVETPSPSLGSRRIRRMPADLQGDILCLQMEDHYVRVHTAEGNDLVLQRLADAVEELAGHDGMQVHRSWWVAREAVMGSTTVNRQRQLVLRNGLQVPISRTYINAVRAAGWLDARDN